jgi:thermitase
MSPARLRLTGALVASVLVSWFLAPAAPALTREPDVYVPNEVVVRLGSAADLGGVAAAYHLDPSPIDQFGSRTIYRLRILDGASPPIRASELLKDPQQRVIDAEPNYLLQAPEGRQEASWAVGGSASGYVAQWAPKAVQLEEAHAISRGAGITVAVLDTGVDATHPALQGRLAPGRDFVDFDGDPSEVGLAELHRGFGHGTHVAGLVALAAPAARIMPVRVIDSDGSGNIWVLAEALAYAVDPDGNPATKDGADVINLSLSTTRRTRLLEELVDEAGRERGRGNARGVVVVAAAGNSGGFAREYPAAEGERGLLAVAASTEADTLASFSTRGLWVHVAAPGEGIISSVPGGMYAGWSGTSMAAALASGQAALVRAAYPGLSARGVVEHVVRTAATMEGPVQRRIDVAKALQTKPR